MRIMRKVYVGIAITAVLALSACSGGGGQAAATAISPEQNAAASSGDSSPEINQESRSETEGEDETVPEFADFGITANTDDLMFPIGGAMGPPAFTGTVYLTPMIANDDVYHFPQTNNIVFEPGSRSHWHTHGGMIILGTGGVGYYQEEGQTAQIIREGDVIECAPGVKHWHGAADDSWFSQMVIYDSHYEGGESGEPEPVTDEYYAALEAEEFTGRTVTADNEFMFQRATEPVTMETFNGSVYLSDVIGGENAAGAPGLHYVVFEHGVINNWHSHAGGQILIATDGIGYHQIEGEPVEVLYPGDVAQCPPGVRHWHGGSAETSFAHIAVNTNPEQRGVEWFDILSEEEYKQLPTEKPEESNPEAQS